MSYLVVKQKLSGEKLFKFNFIIVFFYQEYFLFMVNFLMTVEISKNLKLQTIKCTPSVYDRCRLCSTNLKKLKVFGLFFLK